MSQSSSRRNEGSLIFFQLVIFATGLLLVYLAKSLQGAPSDAINLNRATTEELALALEFDPVLGNLLDQQRKRLGGFTGVKQIARLSVFPDRDAADRARTALRESHLDVNTATPREFQNVLIVPREVASRMARYRDSLPQSVFRKPEDVVRVPIVDERSLSNLGQRAIVRTPAEVFASVAIYGGSLFLLILLVPIALRKAGVKGDPFLIPLGLFLASLGVLILFSIRDPLREPMEFTHHVSGLWLGALALLTGALLPGRPGHSGWLPARANLRRYTYVWALAAMILTLALWRLGSGPEGVRLSLGFFQPVEIIKLLLILFVAGYLSERGGQLADSVHRWKPPVPRDWPALKKGIAVPRRQDLLPLVAMFAAALSLFIIVHDMGPALLLFGAFLITIYLATGRSSLIGLGVILIGIAGWLAYRWKFGVIPVRIDMWLSPWANSHANGMQLGQSIWALSSGGIWGSGLGLGATGGLPRGRDDLIFSALGEELGLLGGLIIIVVYLLIIARGFRIAQRAENDFDRYLAAGLTALLACQTFLIIAGVTGLLPLTGITLPFVAYGNTSLVADFFLLGLLRGISASAGTERAPSPPVFVRASQRVILSLAFGFLGLLGVGRLFWLQAIDADHSAGRQIRTPDADNEYRAKVNPRLLSLERAITRGTIYDRAGRVLATSRLDQISKDTKDDLKSARQYYFRGRYYPRGAAAAHLVGYLDPAIGGPAGIEREFNRPLRGFDDYSDLLADYRAKDLPFLITRRSPRRGQDVFLTIDADLQETTYRTLRDSSGALHDKRNGKRKERAAMVILEPATGQVLAAVSTPSFDPNSMTPKRFKELKQNEDKSSRFVDRARFGLYPPGSSIKVAVAAAALEEGLEPAISCAHVGHDLRWTYGTNVYMRKELKDDKGDPPHGRIKMERAVEVSCNLYFANLGIQLGADRLHRQLADQFDMRAIKPTPAFAADLAQNAFGQGTMLATPLEMARIAGSIANQGRMMKPQFARELKTATGEIVKQYPPILQGRPVGELNSKRLTEMMHRVVLAGTARGIFSGLPVQVAGKTGTAQTEQGDHEPHSWFIGFTPVSKPEYAFACVIENGGYGKQGAAPAVNRVLRTLFK